MSIIKDKDAAIFLSVAVLLGVFAVVLFTVYKDTNKTINFLANLMLGLGCIIALWLKFYHDVKPVWIGIVFAVFLFTVFVIASFAIKGLNLHLSYLFAIPLVFGLALIINRFEPKIISILTKLVHK